MQTGQIFKIHSDFYYVQSEGVTFECKLRHVLKKQKQKHSQYAKKGEKLKSNTQNHKSHTRKRVENKK